MNQTQFLEKGGYLIDEVKTRAEKGSPYFFNADTMSFFKSRISEITWKNGNDIYFITSEKQADHLRFWTIRKSDINGDHKTIGKFQEYDSLKQARQGLKSIFEKLVLLQK